MAFSRRKGAGSDSTKRSRRGRGTSRDPFEHLSEERAKAEEGEPWFLAEDDDAPDLNVQAGISSNLRAEDLALLQEGVGSGPPTTPRDAVRRDRPSPDPSLGQEPGPVAPGTPMPDPGEGPGVASVFTTPDPEAPSSHPDPEPPTTTSAFDAESLGSLTSSVFEDSSRPTQAYGERSPGDTLAPPADNLRAVFDEPRSDVPEFVAPEPVEASVVDEAASDPDTASAYTEQAATEAASIDVVAIPVETEETEPELDESDVVSLVSEPERFGSADVTVEPGHLESEATEEAGAPVPEDPDITPAYAEPVVANPFDELTGEVPASEPSATSVADQPDVAQEAEAPATVPETPDEEPLRSALLQSFKDVVARAPAAPEDEGDVYSLGVKADAPEQPEPEEVRPRKPPSRPRRF